MTKASDNEFPSVLFAEQGSDPSTPASGFWRLYPKSDGFYMIDDAGNVSGPFAEDAGAGTFNPLPALTNFGTAFSSSSTTVAATITAPATTDHLVAVVYSTGRAPNSVTGTNMTWTQRYTGNGNSQHLSVYTGVAASSAGTSVTASFTGSNNQQIDVFTIDSPSALTAASAAATATAASTALTTVSASGSPVVEGAYVIAATCAASPTSSYSGFTHPVRHISAFGGQGRSGITQMNGRAIAYWSLSSSAVNFFTAIIVIS